MVQLLYGKNEIGAIIRQENTVKINRKEIKDKLLK